MEGGPVGKSSKVKRSSRRASASKPRARANRTSAKLRLWEGQDVLARWTDGLLYLGNIRKIDRWKQTCLVQFEDNSEFWVLLKDIYPRYHQKCHAPKIEADIGVPTSWICRSCVFAVATKKGGALKKGPYAKAMQAMKRVLPYQLKSLEWDSQHLSNQQQCYCYCGGPGEWNLKMLQCCRCQHWFHEACTQCLSKPLLYGDRFYLFVCCVCTGGAEYVKRLPLEWVDIAHLVLYHLSTCCRRKYFDFEREILAFANENWDNLLVGQLSGASKSERYEQILNALNKHRNRFVSGKEIKKKKCIFGLQERLPPQPPPTATLCEIASQLMGNSASPLHAPNRSELEGLKKLKAKRAPRHRDTQDLYELKTRRARRLLQKAISQNMVANPSSPNQSYQGCRGSASACPIRESTERTPPKMMYASIQPSSNAVRSLESSSSSSFEYGENSGSQAKTIGSGGRLSDGEEGADERPLDPVETEEEEEEEEEGGDEEEEEEEDGSDNQMDARSQCDSSEDDLPLSYLRSSVSSYFGAMGRLARGETVRILARRLTLDNKVQYLVEWGGSSIF
ncbi:PHD finger protein 1-like isoform X2 [Heterodontus francisci]|uniref:PHD finger protein 1-like isoform X2 n=1 Tax=Heterodontus francisci TaxID=7792 RepID=UPI00355B8A29